MSKVQQNSAIFQSVYIYIYIYNYIIKTIFFYLHHVVVIVIVLKIDDYFEHAVYCPCSFCWGDLYKSVACI